MSSPYDWVIFKVVIPLWCLQAINSYIYMRYYILHDDNCKVLKYGVIPFVGMFIVVYRNRKLKLGVD